MTRLFYFFAISVLAVGCVTKPNAPSPLQLRLEARLQSAIDDEKIAPGMAFVVLDENGARYEAAAGVADPAGRLFTIDTPVRIASITKTLTAATVLRLWEDGQIDLEAPIAGLIDPEFDTLLRGDGYDTNAITVRHLLTHTAGLPDHADDAYVEIVSADPARNWTRRDQVALAVDNHDPLGPPDGQFSYSDTGYILLGDIIERRTGEPLARVVRRALKFEDIGLDASWWEIDESPPVSATPRAHQYVSGVDTTGWNGSVDLYGGGGFIMSTHDLARFMRALMDNKIFESPETLRTMIASPGNQHPDRYRFGLFPYSLNDVETYYHSGFWGTFVSYATDIDIVVAGAVLDQSGYSRILEIVSETIADFQKNR